MWPIHFCEMDAAAERKRVDVSDCGCQTGATAPSGDSFCALQVFLVYHTLTQLYDTLFTYTLICLKLTDLTATTNTCGVFRHNEIPKFPKLSNK